MKCQELLKSISIKNSVLAILIAVGASNTHVSFASSRNIDSICAEIAQTMQCGMTPENVILYDSLQNKIEALLLDFVSIQNTESVAAHVEKFDKALTDYKTKIVDSPTFAPIKHNSSEIHGEFIKLINILRQFIGKTGKHMDLAKAIEPYRRMVPSKIANQINGALIACLRNRMKRA